jgi:uncharacterized protein (TIGR02996 family)
VLEEQFLAAIAAAPDDSHLKLVYADWLDEQGEGLRAAFLRRVATESYGDGFHELHARVGRLWLARLTEQRLRRYYIGPIPIAPYGRWSVQADLGQIALNILLGTYGSLNGQINDLHSYDAVVVRNTGDWRDALTGLFTEGHVPNDVALERLDDWDEALRRVLNRWLRPSDNADECRWHADRVIAGLYDVLRPAEGWQVQFDFPERFAILEWDGILLAQGDVGLLLHFCRHD